MPIYEYKCQTCGDVFERLCFSSDGEESVDCPACGGKKTERVLSAFCSVSSNSGGDLGASNSCAPHGGFS